MSQPSMPPATLDGWLCYLELLHPANIELGLERINQVFQRLQLDFSNITVITVAGTNGKGTTCTMVEQAALKAGKSTAVYSSPHINDYRERLRLNNAMLSAQEHCDAFSAVEQARGDIALTYFEFGTLAALYLIAKAQPQIALLEVGLGGRLDATNIVTPNLAVITTIDLDHQDWLGDTREKIAVEKAGILRQQGEAIISELEPPSTLISEVERMQVSALWQGRDFSLVASAEGLQWTGKDSINGLPVPNIPVQNAATAMAVCEWLALPLSAQQWRDIFASVQVPGRCQVLNHKPLILVDVAHNPQSARYLAQKIAQHDYQKLHLVVAMLTDKDIEQTLAPFSSLDADWYLAGLSVPRGAKSGALKAVLAQQKIVLECDQVTEAYQQAQNAASEDDMIVVFGSFFTAAEVIA